MTKGVVAYFLVYIDDILLTGNNVYFKDDFVAALACRFSIKDLGAFHQFLGFEVVFTGLGMLSSQGRYLADILWRFKMDRSKDVSTPMSADGLLQQTDSSAIVDATGYRQLIGMLQYLLITSQT